MSKVSMRNKIIRMISESGRRGMTCDEVEQRGRLLHQTASARIRELEQDGVVTIGGGRRETRSGCSARVYKITK